MEQILKEKVVKQYIFLSTLFAMSHMITAAIYVSFLQEKGMSLLQVNLINGVFYAAIFIGEIPTGAYADIFGRKKSFVMACTLRGIAEIMYGLSDTVWGFLASEIISAIGYTFMSGAFKAWVVDSLIHRGYSEVDSRVFGRSKFYSQIFGIGSCILGSYLGSIYSLSFPWIIGGIIAIITGVVGHWIMKEEYFVHKEYSWKKGLIQMKQIVRSSFHYGRNDKAVRFIIVTSFILVFAAQPLNMYWQPFFRDHGVPTKHLGYIFSGILLSLAIGGGLAGFVKSNGNEKNLIIISQISIGLSVMLAAFLDFRMALAFFLIHEVGRGFQEPMRDSYLHRRIPSHERATIDSFCSISPHLGGFFGLLTSGLIAEYGGISLSWIISALILIAGALLVAKNGKH